MSDQSLKCVDCNFSFIFSEGEQKFYEEKGFLPPRRCKECRMKKKNGMNVRSPQPSLDNNKFTPRNRKSFRYNNQEDDNYEQ